MNHLRPINRKLISLKCFFLWMMLGLLLAYHQGNAQQSRCGLRISLLTSGPGDALYATWGHSAIRIIDSARYMDLVFNYGTFDYDTPHFYLKLLRGNLMYYLSYEPYDYFREDDREENRQLSEQVLDLNCADKERIYQYLINNYMPDKRYYRYDFLYDNCSTRILGLLYQLLGNRLKFRGKILSQPGMTYRNACNLYLKDKPWTSLGINLMIGMTTDTPAGNRGITFLPDFLEKAVSLATLDGHPLDTTNQVLLQAGTENNQPTPFTPLLIFTALLIFIVTISSGKLPFSAGFQHWTDVILFFLTGLLGWLLLLLWLATEHTQFAWNLNLLWALPSHCLFSVFLDRRNNRVKWYAAITALIGILLIAGWFWIPQQLPVAIIPLILALVIRSSRIFILNHRPAVKPL
ncbi:MAG TPA: DUF4105 domain-containing protein [Chitinophagaceae bacterium]|nr:DUF4105 domain-containing protein [Chitinophagaceae bacterium]